ncbi:MAG: flagellar hook-length control protein FliK [Lachnospiraceae bacterium]|jgi:flagellar hook-length control protein FliK|nr:flagellar hook-length control protein FliK [Lachnospiraceae bacterium]
MAVIQKATDAMNLLASQPSNTVKTGSKNLDFQKVMETTGTADKTTEKQQMNQKDEKVKVAGSANDLMKDKLAAVNNKSVVTEESVPEEEVLASVQVLLQNIKELIQDVFQITEEELSDVMGKMEITDMDLLNPQVISDLAVEISGAENALELLFQPEFTETLKELQTNINTVKEEVFSKLHVTEKEVVHMIETVAAKEEGILNKEVKTDPALEQGKEVQKEEVENVTKVVQTEPTDSEQKEMSFQTEDQKDFKGTQQTLAESVISNLEQAITEAMPADISEVDAEKIVRQVITQIQVSVKADTSSFEMQLYPEHLGKISLQIASKDGIVTAQIATETEMAKQALESQLITLKENLNQQGVKIEAVEVVIASHEFERNLDSQANGEEENKQNGNRQHRKIDFDILQASEEELTPQEAIIREMMLANGNKINYMA